MGWTIGAWMLFTGTGSLIGGRKKDRGTQDKAIRFALLLIGAMPICFVFLMNFFKNMIFPPGVLINPVHFLLILCITLSPIGILSGYLYALLVRTCRKEDNGYIKVYAIEAIGSLAGGLIVSLAFIYWLSILQSLILVLLIVVLSLFFMDRNRQFLLASGFLAIIIIVSFIVPFDRFLKSFLFINQEVVQSKETYYGNITITKNADQYNIFENGMLSFTTDNVIIREEYVHYVMLQKKNPENILLIGGGISGMLSEILKYPSVRNLDYVELNPQLISIAARYFPLPRDQKVRMIIGDGRKHLQRTDEQYDVVILAIPDPSSLQANRFYTLEFIRTLKKKLQPGAVILLSHSPAGNYVDSETSRIEGTIYTTLSLEFSHITIIPGENDYFLASDDPLDLNISALTRNSDVDNSYVNPYYMDDQSIGQRSRYIVENIADQGFVNSDKQPLPVFFHTLKFLSQFDLKNTLYLVIPIVFLILPVFFMRSVSVGIFVAGFTGSSIELMLIFAFQTFYGYVYSTIGLIIAMFMGGLAFGAFYAARRSISRKHFILAQSLLLIYALLFPVFWDIQLLIPGNFLQLTLFFIITFLLAAIIGYQYVAGTGIYKSETTRAATTLYGADLLGSSLGVITVTLVLLPLLGIQKSCLVIAGLNIGAVALNLFKKT